MLKFIYNKDLKHLEVEASKTRSEKDIYIQNIWLVRIIQGDNIPITKKGKEKDHRMEYKLKIRSFGTNKMLILVGLKYTLGPKK